METNIIISFIGASALLALSPGPDNIFVLTQSITNGIKFGIATVLGLVTGCLVHTTLVAIGVSAIINENDKLFFVLKLFGASYLLYLAYKVLRDKSTVNLSSKNIEKKSLVELYKQGFIMNVLNPKVSIFFLAFFPAFLFSKTIDQVYQFFILGFLFMTVTLVVFSLIALLAGYISNYLKQHSKAFIFLKWSQVIVFIGIAIFILFSGK